MGERMHLGWAESEMEKSWDIPKKVNLALGMRF